MQIFLEFAVKNAKTKEEMLEVEFYSLYLRKLGDLQQGNNQEITFVIKIGNKEEFQSTTEELIRLCNEEHHPIAMVFTRFLIPNIHSM